MIVVVRRTLRLALGRGRVRVQQCFHVWIHTRFGRNTAQRVLLLFRFEGRGCFFVVVVCGFFGPSYGSSFSKSLFLTFRQQSFFPRGLGQQIFGQSLYRISVQSTWRINSIRLCILHYSTEIYFFLDFLFWSVVFFCFLGFRSG